MATKKAAKTKRKASAPEWRVRIRMYRKWLGDCFLLSFRHGSQLSHILIDCGALSGTPGGKAMLNEAAQHILDEVKDAGGLGALVVTHEHWDHVSGFADAIDVFKNIPIREVWAGWTEAPGQSILKEKKKIARDQLQAIGYALSRWNQSPDAGRQALGEAVAPLLAFSENTDKAMKAALKLAKPSFLKPGKLFEPEWLPGVRVHVLGPPQDPKWIRDDDGNPSTDMYGGRDALAAANRGSVAAFAAAAGANGGFDQYAPFDRHLRWDAPEWEKRWIGLAESYNGDAARKIDCDWLNAAAEMALQLDNDTNNTSLVLAFELGDGGPVLLFVGDAQIGNWLSWANSAAGLLERTVFYKVGHHGSHNATLKPGGLEAMVSPDLVAAIPVDEDFARRPKGRCPDGWDMPAGPLLDRIEQLTRGRVLRGDSDFPADADADAAPKIKGAEPLSSAEWKRFRDAVKTDPKFIEYYLD